MTPVVSSGEGAGGVKRRRLERNALGVSLGVHLTAFALIFWGIPALEDPPILYEVVHVDMVAMAPEPPDELVVETPDDPPPAPEEEVPLPEPEPEPEPDRTPPKRRPSSRKRRPPSRRGPPKRRRRTKARTRSRSRSRR